MKNLRFPTFLLILGSLILSACGGAVTTTPEPVPTSASTSVNAMPVTFIGVVDSIDGDQWTISGTTVTVKETVVHDGPFRVGDQVKVEGLVHPDGSFTILRVEAPAVVSDNTNDAFGNANTNDTNINEDNSNTSNSNDDNSNGGNGNTNDGNTNDDNSNNGNGNTNDEDNSNNDNGNSNDDNSNDDDDDNSNDDRGNENDNDRDDDDDDDNDNDD